MKKLLNTNGENWSALVARLVLGATVFAHGAQKLFGWFGGYGFKGTMGFLTGQAGLSSFIALMVILIESVAALMIIAGLFTRFAAIGIFGLFAVIMFKFHSANGFFMNWAGNQKGEGIEYFIILLGVALTLIIAGGGKASVDAALAKNKNNS
jgi:putative oxidoreductase